MARHTLGYILTACRPRRALITLNDDNMRGEANQQCCIASAAGARDSYSASPTKDEFHDVRGGLKPLRVVSSPLRI